MYSIFKLIDNESKYYTIYLSTFTKDVEDNTMEQIEHFIANCEDPTSKFWQTREDVKIEFLGGFTVNDYAQFLDKTGILYNSVLNDNFCTQTNDGYLILIPPPKEKKSRVKKEVDPNAPPKEKKPRAKKC